MKNLELLLDNSLVNLCLITSQRKGTYVFSKAQTMSSNCLLFVQDIQITVTQFKEKAASSKNEVAEYRECEAFFLEHDSLFIKTVAASSTCCSSS